MSKGYPSRIHHSIYQQYHNHLTADTILLFTASVDGSYDRCLQTAHNAAHRACITAVREDEIRASAVGVFPLRYKLLAFAVGAGLIGALGSFQAQYITIVCPSDLALALTTTLLIIVFVGGVGHMRGVIIGAIIFSGLPRLLEVSGVRLFTPAYQQIAYGLILILVMIYMPDGLDGFISRTTERFRRAKKLPSDVTESDADSHGGDNST